MLYFSELKKKKVYTEDNIYVGELEDLIFLASETPIISKLIIRTNLKEKLIIPSGYIININSELVITKNYIISDLEENELHVVKNLLDKQIIDLKGNKIVRVNDIILQQDKKTLYVMGVDIGLMGIFRWFGFEKLLAKISRLIGIQPTSKLLSWADIQPLELATGKVKLRKKEDKLKKVRPEDLADYLEKTNVINARKLLGILDDPKAADVISSLNINYQTALFKHYKPEKAAKFINLIDPDDAIDVLLTLSLKRRENILNLLSNEKKHELMKLLNISKNQVGSYITSQYLTVTSDEIVKSTLLLIKNSTSHFATLEYIYVVNKINQLVGVFNLHELLLQDKDTPIYKFMIQNVIVTHLTTPKELVLKKMIKYEIKAIPVIDDNKQILGIINLYDIAKSILEK